MLNSINAEQSTQLSQVLTTLSRIECRNAFQPGRSASDWIQILLKHAAIGWLYLNFKQGGLPGVNRGLQCSGHLDGITYSTALQLHSRQRLIQNRYRVNPCQEVSQYLEKRRNPRFQPADTLGQLS